ncbi:MAG: SMI1/KNR4 family protein [Clostridiales bacterium]|nr:SMI1/KNR4 family protein [Clostridiales bacterium]
MKLEEFIKNEEVLKSQNLVDKEFLNNIENLVGLKFGNQLSEYILKYGFLLYESVEFYGINSKQNLESDLVKQTIYLHKYFPTTNNFFAFENLGDGFYAIVNDKDEVHYFNSENNKLENIKISLFDYILKRFNEEKNI